MSGNSCGMLEIANATDNWLQMDGLFEYQPWLFSLLGSAMVGLSGILPLLVIPDDSLTEHKYKGDSSLLKILLSFAVGGLLGDVFLHLLPEAWENFELEKDKIRGCRLMTNSGLWVLSGFCVFVVAEKIFSNPEEDEEFEVENDKPRTIVQIDEKTAVTNGHKFNNNNSMTNGELKLNGFARTSDLLYSEALKSSSILKDECNNGLYIEKKKNVTPSPVERQKHISGYLNLMANCIDNFTHGLAVGGSFLVSFRLGALTTFAILIHEIPHEIGDFAILLKSGFSRLDAAKAQIVTAGGGISGALVAILFSGDAVEAKTSWILPFTAGSFLHIAMVTVLPELLKESNSRESLKQLGAFVGGIIIIAFVTNMVDEKQFLQD